jgi:hypothetical protein
VRETAHRRQRRGRHKNVEKGERWSGREGEGVGQGHKYRQKQGNITKSSGCAAAEAGVLPSMQARGYV